jgi:hypothetical protein
VICVLWSLWTSHSVAEWLRLMRAGAVWGGPEWLPGALGGLLVCAVVMAGWERVGDAGLAFGRSLGVSVALLLIMLAPTRPMVQDLLGDGATQVAERLAQEGLSAQDRSRLVRGYYERIQQVERLDSPLWGLMEQAAADDEAAASERSDPEADDEGVRLFEKTGDFYYIRMIPGAEGVFKRVPFRVNRWGMRDRDYALEKEDGVIRIAILGASHVMGQGVSHEDLFHEIVEDRLNGEISLDRNERFELLSFAMYYYSVLTQVHLIEDRVLDFDPDVIFYFGHTSDVEMTIVQLSRVLRSGTTIPDPAILAVLEETGVTSDMTHDEIRARLLPRSVELTSHGYRRIAEISRARGILPVFIFTPRPREWGVGTSPMDMVELASSAGMETLSLLGAFIGPGGRRNVAGLSLSRWDFHPNARGHRLLADRLWEVLEENPGLLTHRRTQPESP